MAPILARSEIYCRTEMCEDRISRITTTREFSCSGFSISSVRQYILQRYRLDATVLAAELELFEDVAVEVVDVLYTFIITELDELLEWILVVTPRRMGNLSLSLVVEVLYGLSRRDLRWHGRMPQSGRPHPEDRGVTGDISRAGIGGA